MCQNTYIPRSRIDMHTAPQPKLRAPRSRGSACSFAQGRGPSLAVLWACGPPWMACAAHLALALGVVAWWPALLAGAGLLWAAYDEPLLGGMWAFLSLRGKAPLALGGCPPPMMTAGRQPGARSSPPHMVEMCGSIVLQPRA